MSELERYVFIAIAFVVFLGIGRLTFLALFPEPFPRCTLVEQDPDDHSTTETRARLSDGQ